MGSLWWFIIDSLAWKLGYGTLEIDSLQLQVCLLNGTFHVLHSLNAVWTMTYEQGFIDAYYG